MPTPIMARQLEAYGEIVTRDLKLGGAYDESQCNACPHGHRCCDLSVTCTPYEALGIIGYLVQKFGAGAKDILDRVAMRAKVMYDHMQGFKNVNEALDAWYKKKLRCVFYDHDGKKCSIYPVRPVTCRSAYGKGDCETDGVRTLDEDPDLFMVRAKRVEIPLMQGQGADEMNKMITNLRNKVRVQVSPEDKGLMNTDPALLTEEQLLWGYKGAPFNPIPEI